MKLFPLVLFLALLAVACAPQGVQESQGATGDEQATTAAPPSQVHCPFDVTFTSEHYVKQEYFVIKPILPGIDAEDCDNALRERRNVTESLCRVQHAEIIRPAGREDGKDTWQWRIDCACSYQPR